jgi:uncharacterized damage-inducible protein DinB
MLEDLDPRYPIGKVEDQPFADKKEYDEDAKAAHMLHIKMLPQLLEFAVENLDADQLHTPYREGGWTVHQLVHHLADSHMNAVIRFKLGLTEENPTLKPYDEAAWATLSDTENLPVNISLTLLYALHTKWYELLKNIKEADWNRKVFHPALNRGLSLWQLLMQYSWHGRHHVAHITMLKKARGW